MSRLLRISSAFLLLTFVSCGSDEPAPPDSGTADIGEQIDSQHVETCGNGELDPGEDCDTAIVDGVGVCPTSCDDNDACTTDELLGSDCSARCRVVAITACTGTESDGCCPEGCDAASDVDCGTCGNGDLDPGERCDTAIAVGEMGACPVACDDGNACTIDTLTGTGCGVRCSSSVQTQCNMTSDGCCPSGCTSTTDTDCSASCGDGVLDEGETCDTAIPVDTVGACPVACDDGIACTHDELVGSGCNISCSNREIDACNASVSDGCCSAGCTTATDIDCKAECGNGVLDDGETCDIKIDPTSVGACPEDCTDGIACTVDKLVSAGTCTASCSNTSITQCVLLKSDGCCPAGCSSLTDTDCRPECGNGELDKGETCDVKIPVGELGACPTRCDDGIACTTDKLVAGGTCTASCATSSITQCSKLSDGCCPTGCSSITDPDCKAECGNGVLDTDETCDVKISAGDEGACPTSCDDKDVCTIDKLVAGGTCTAECSFAAITACSLKADGCCVKGCNANTDADCKPECGNAVVELGENCDIKIEPGLKGACPTACDDGQVCTKDALEGTDCAAECTTKPITDCSTFAKDGCCPDNCNANT
ncbi:MAG: hypothetical protein JRH20_10960, partial [Deltaproteobacteria bacterium]|nr:hypothetical protein [Deltaproteobacteria bacterium]